MADIIDNAQEQEELIILAALSNRPKPQWCLLAAVIGAERPSAGEIFARAIAALKTTNAG